ncbi:type II toxin-antitoxin system PemK/MazF family toxin [Peribacillus frigoritolerans]|uniref:type II toxin-antitoxin system PemK/MazF family toxin n=1 Tax=Peribacillus frigoritolerans TaxID=450367 RepID=UPI0039A3491C
MKNEIKAPEEDVILLSFLPIGSIVNARLEFKHIETSESIRSTPRPVLVLRDYGDGAVKVATLTSRIEKKHVQEYGHLLEKSEEYGLKKKSAVLCTKFNMGVLAKENLSEPYAHVPFTEMKMILEKAESLNKKEHGFQMKLVSELER